MNLVPKGECILTKNQLKKKRSRPALLCHHSFQSLKVITCDIIVYSPHYIKGWESGYKID